MSSREIELTKAFARSKLKGIPFFGISQTKRVKRNAELISQGIKFDERILEIAILLHNVGAKHHLNFNQDLAETSVALAKRFLESNNFSKKDVEKVIHCISEQCVEGKPKTIEAMVLHDAVLLENIGAIGILRSCYRFGATKKPVFKVIKYFKEFSDLLPKAFFTEKGKKLSQSNIQFFIDFVKNIEKEFS